MTKNDYALTRAEWFIQYMASFEWSREQAVAWLEVVYSPLLDFMRENHLLSNPDFKVENWSEFVLMNSDLTEEGGTLYGRCEQKWLRSVGRGKKNLADMNLWKRELDKLQGMSH